MRQCVREHALGSNLSCCLVSASYSFPQTRSFVWALICMRRSGGAGVTDATPPESIALGAVRPVLFLRIADVCFNRSNGGR